MPLIHLARAWAFFRSPLGRVLGVGLIAVLALAYAYGKGAERAAGQCEADTLRARIATLERDLEAARRAEALAREQEAAAREREKTLNERQASYENGLGKTKPGCELTPADANGLLNLTR